MERGKIMMEANKRGKRNVGILSHFSKADAEKILFAPQEELIVYTIQQDLATMGKHMDMNL